MSRARTFLLSNALLKFFSDASIAAVPAEFPPLDEVVVVGGGVEVVVVGGVEIVVVVGGGVVVVVVGGVVVVVGGAVVVVGGAVVVGVEVGEVIGGVDCVVTGWGGEELDIAK